MAAIEEIETLLQSLLALKPPGVTKTKIQTLTEKCTENVQVCEPDAVLSCALRIDTDVMLFIVVRGYRRPKDRPTIQEKPRDPQTRCPIRCRLGSSRMA